MCSKNQTPNPQIHDISYLLFLVANDLQHSRIFLLDNLDLGMFNKQYSVLPRVNVFDQDSIQRMITMATDVGKTTPSYAGAPVSASHPSRMCCFFLNVISDSPRTTHIVQLRHISTMCYAHSKHSAVEQLASRNTAKPPFQPASSCGGSTARTSQRDVPSPTSAHHLIDELIPMTISLLGPMNFTNYLWRQYPLLANYLVPQHFVHIF